ncbi:helix-turn-helix domain-containing protein [Neobacillus sp. NRS-1170]|uniref:helix-turn-helix domain-containing protein n=1 Tax=Neobacillus sp. NRS-1170 TaxID=3233898 RepID=UPI003D2CAE41
MKKDQQRIFIGHVIRPLRTAKGMTQDELAHYSRLNRTFVGALERNEKAPSLYTVFKLG